MDTKETALLDGKQMARILGVNYFTLMSWAESGLIPSLKLSSIRRFDREVVLEHIRSGKMKSLADAYFARKRKEKTAREEVQAAAKAKKPKARKGARE